MYFGPVIVNEANRNDFRDKSKGKGESKRRKERRQEKVFRKER